MSTRRFNANELIHRSYSSNIKFIFKFLIARLNSLFSKKHNKTQSIRKFNKRILFFDCKSKSNINIWIDFVVRRFKSYEKKLFISTRKRKISSLNNNYVIIINKIQFLRNIFQNAHLTIEFRIQRIQNYRKIKFK